MVTANRDNHMEIYSLIKIHISFKYVIIPNVPCVSYSTPPIQGLPLNCINHHTFVLTSLKTFSILLMCRYNRQ